MFPNPKSPSSGRFVAEQARALSKLIDIKIVSPVPTGPFIKYLPGYCQYTTIPHQINHEGIDVYFPRYLLLPKLFSVSNWTFPLSVKKALADIYRSFPFDLIHAHTIFPDGYAAIKVTDNFHCPVVITGHGYDVYDIPWRNYLFLRSCQEAVRKSDQLISVSKSLLPDLKKLGARDDRTTIIPNGVDIKLFSPENRTACRKKLDLSDKKRIILCVANLFEIKGVEYLLRAFAEVQRKLPDTALFIVGEGPLFHRLSDLQNILGLKESAFLVGGKPHSELPVWFNAADLVVLPSLNESFGIVLIEAMACGIPIVASDVGGIPDIVADDKVGLLTSPGDKEALANTLIKALNRDWNRSSISERAKKYSMSSVANQLAELYEQAVAKKLMRSV